MDDAPAQEQQQKSVEPLTYEETPVIEPIAQKQEAAPPPVQPPRPSFFKKFFGFIGNLILFTLLFVFGIWLSTMLGQFVPGERETSQLPSPTPTGIASSPQATPSSTWMTYQVLTAGSKQPVGDVSFQLPPEVLAPVCDGGSCSSQGTYLPGGTRLTVATRTTSVSFMRTALITDAGGKPFTKKEATVSGTAAIEYTGTFRGTTTGGYTFTQMRGVMIGVSSKLTLEFNHFAPVGVTSDFVADDTLFDKILETLQLPASAAPPATPTVATSSATP